MTMKQILVSAGAAIALSISGSAIAEQPATPLVSGDEPMNVESAEQIKAPDPSAEAQAKTEKMLKEEAGEISGDVTPATEADAAQMKAAKPSAEAQAKTEEMLKEEEGELQGR
jgi:hypothetical protein